MNLSLVYNSEEKEEEEKNEKCRETSKRKKDRRTNNGKDRQKKMAGRERVLFRTRYVQLVLRVRSSENESVVRFFFLFIFCRSPFFHFVFYSFFFFLPTTKLPFSSYTLPTHRNFFPRFYLSVLRSSCSFFSVTLPHPLHFLFFILLLQLYNFPS